MVDSLSDQDEPLLLSKDAMSLNDEDESADPKKHPSRVLYGALANLTIGAAGAGLLSFPWAVARQGIASTIIFTVVFAIFNVVTLSILARVAIGVAPRLGLDAEEEDSVVRRTATSRNGKIEALASDHSFDALVGAVFGSRWRRFASVTVLIGCYGSLIGFLIVVGDVGVPAFQVILRECDGDEKWYCWLLCSRAGLTLLISVLVLLPLTSLERIDNLAHSSLLGILSVVAVAMVIFIRSGDASQEGYPAFSGGKKPVAFQPSFSVALGIPLAVFALGNHLQLVPVVADAALGSGLGFWPKHMDGKRPVTEVWGTDGGRFSWTAFGGSALICSMLYLSTGVAGYLLFGDKVQGDVLVSFPPQDLLADIAKVLLTIHIVMAFPLIAYPSREAVTALVREVVPALHQIPPTIVRIVIAALQLTACGLVAVLVPKVVVFFGLLGATTSATQIYLIPASLFWRASVVRNKHQSQASQKNWETQWAIRDQEGIHGWRYAGAFLPSHPRHMFLLSMLLYVIGAAVIVLGTYSTIQHTWFDKS